MNNIEFENIPAEEPESKTDLPELNGSWERKGRSITAAAISGLLGIGVIYFNVQSVLALILIVIYGVVFQIDMSASLADRINAATYEFKAPILLALIISQYLFMLAPALWITKKWHTSKIRKYLRIQLCSLKEIGLAVLITISLLPFCYYISYLILRVFKIPKIFENLGEQLFTAHSGGELLILIFVVAVTPAICEETFFRGYFQRTLERTAGTKSFIITGIIFGLFHMQPLSLISLSVLGILFSFFYYRSKSIFPSSAAHFTNNFIAILLLYLQPKATASDIPYDGNIPFLWVIASLTVAAAFMFSYIKITKVPYSER